MHPFYSKRILSKKSHFQGQLHHFYHAGNKFLRILSRKINPRKSCRENEPFIFEIKIANFVNPADAKGISPSLFEIRAEVKGINRIGDSKGRSKRLDRTCDPKCAFWRECGILNWVSCFRRNQNSFQYTGIYWAQIGVCKLVNKANFCFPYFKINFFLEFFPKKREQQTCCAFFQKPSTQLLWLVERVDVA